MTRQALKQHLSFPLSHAQVHSFTSDTSPPALVTTMDTLSPFSEATSGAKGVFMASPR